VAIVVLIASVLLVWGRSRILSVVVSRRDCR